MAEWFMPFVTKRQPLSLSARDQERLEDLRRSRSAEKRQVLHAAILLDSAKGMSDNAVAAANRVNRHTVALCIRKFLQFGIDAALGDLPRPGKSRRIPDDALAWVLHCACQKPKELGYAYELWTYALLQTHVRKHCLEANHPSLLKLSRSKLHRILTQSEVRPHKIRYYVERRDPDFERKMIEVLHVYKDVEVVNAGLVEGTLKEPSTVTISYDDKSGIQALAPTTPDRPPAPNRHSSHLRDYEYKRLGTISLLAGLHLHTGSLTDIVSDRHFSLRFISLLVKLHAAYPAQARIRLLLTTTRPTFPRKRKRPSAFTHNGSSSSSHRNTVLGLISSRPCSADGATMLRGIRVASKQALIDRIHLYFAEVNADPAIFRWKYRMDEVGIA